MVQKENNRSVCVWTEIQQLKENAKNMRSAVVTAVA